MASGSFEAPATSSARRTLLLGSHEVEPGRPEDREPGQRIRLCPGVAEGPRDVEHAVQRLLDLGHVVDDGDGDVAARCP